MPDIWMDCDTNVTVPVNILPLLDATDFKTIETAVAYNAGGLSLNWNFCTAAGGYTCVAVTPTDTGGNYDWSEPLADVGMYKIEIPASGGASINNDTEGVGWFTGSATGVLPWRGPTIGFRRAALNDLLIDGSTASTNLEDFFDGTGYAGGTAKLGVNVINVNGTAQTAGDLAAELAKVPKSDSNVTWNATALASIQTEANDALVANNLDHLCLTATGAADMTTEVADNTILSRFLANGDTSAFDPSTMAVSEYATDDEVALALLKYDMSTVADEAARSPVNALRALRNKTVIGSGTITVYKENDSTEAWSGTATSDAGASPITSIDPA